MQISKLFTQLQLLGSLAREQDKDSYIYVFVYIYREKETQTWCEVAGLPRCAFIFIKTESVTAIRKERTKHMMIIISKYQTKPRVW